METSNEEIKMIKIRRKYNYYENNVRSITDFLLIVFGIFLYSKGLLAIPTFVILYNYQSKVKNLLTGVVQLLEYNKKFVVASNRIYEVIENERFKKEKFGTTKVKKLEGSIRFLDVSFGYDDKKILNHMNFEVTPNQKVAFVGKMVPEKPPSLI